MKWPYDSRNRSSSPLVGYKHDGSVDCFILLCLYDSLVWVVELDTFSPEHCTSVQERYFSTFRMLTYHNNKWWYKSNLSELRSGLLGESVICLRPMQILNDGGKFHLEGRDELVFLKTRSISKADPKIVLS